MRPIVDMQFADFSTIGFNQIVNHAGAYHWRTNVPCPITIRLPGGGTSGGGPFHSQSLEAIYAHFPGVVVMTPGPGRIESDNRLELPRPRDVASPEFNAVRRVLGAKLHSHHAKKAA